MVKGDVIITIAISHLNLVYVKHWVVDSSITRHTYANKDTFISYSLVGNEEELVYLGYSWIAKVLGKEKILFKLTSCIMLALNQALHVPNIQ